MLNNLKMTIAIVALLVLVPVLAILGLCKRAVVTAYRAAWARARKLAAIFTKAKDSK